MLETMITSSVLILGICCIQWIFRQRMPAGVQYGLWLLVAVRLMLPLPEMVCQNVLQKDFFRMQSSVSIMNIVEWMGRQRTVSGTERTEAASDGMPGTDQNGKQAAAEDQQNEGNVETEALEKKYFVGEPASSGMPGTDQNGKQAAAEDQQNEGNVETEVLEKTYFVEEPLDQELTEVMGSINGGGSGLSDKLKGAGAAVWCIGMLLLAVWQMAVALRFRRFLVKNRREIEFRGQKLYAIEGVASPFLIWDKLFCPVIYVPEQITGKEGMMRHAVAHEKAHQKHGDLWWAFLRNLLVTVYWFHPLVWLAARMSRRDCEIYCDACVIRGMEDGEREAYGKDLLHLLEQNRQSVSPLSLTTSMGGGRGEMKERIRRIAVRRHMRKWQGVLLAAVLLLLVGSTYTAANSRGDRGVSRISGDHVAEQKTASVREASKPPLTMDTFIELCQSKKLSEITYEEYLSYSNSQEEADNGDDGALNCYIRFDLQKGSKQYQVEVSFDKQDKKLDTVYITDQETGESRFLYTSDESFQDWTESIETFLDHGDLLDSRLVYRLPDGLNNGRCYYNVAGNSGGPGRLFYDGKDQKRGIYGTESSVIWSAAGGVYQDYTMTANPETGLPSCSWAEYRGNGRYAAKGDVVTTLKNGALQEIPGCEDTTSIEGIEISRNALPAQEEARWYLPPAGSEDAVPPESVRDLLPLKLWVVCVQAQDAAPPESCFVFFLNADRYARKDAVKLAKSVHVFSIKELVSSTNEFKK